MWKKKGLIWLLAASLVMPGVSGIAAEDVILVQDTETVVSEMTDPGFVEGAENGAEIVMSDEAADPDEIVVQDEITEAPDVQIFVEAMEELEDFEDLAEIPLPEEEVYIIEEMEHVADAGEAANAGTSVFRTYTAAEYNGSYGAQLEGGAAQIYAALVNTYAVEKKFEPVTIKLDKGYDYVVTDGGYDANGKHLYERDEASYLEAKTRMAYDVQSAYDAFMYDYPDVFWFSSFTYLPTSVLYLKGGVYTGGAFKSIKITPKERYKGAAGEVAAFDAAVQKVAAEIASMLPANASQIEILEEIHDYLCFEVTYQENSYAHTAAGVFLKGKAVVCEGYAKAYKILCEKFGIESVLIPGGALKSDQTIEGHMWNYVKLDGIWYMVDTTWDDQEAYISKIYFLAGSGTRGFNAVIEQERTLYNKFSGQSVNSQSFVMPVLGEAAYTGTYHEWKTVFDVDREASCSLEGIQSSHCRKCDVSKENTAEKIPKLPHELDDGIVAYEPTCSVPGLMIYICEVCGEEEADEIPTIEHNWETEYTVDREATCALEGSESIHCVDCTAKKEMRSIEKPDHEWDDGKIAHESTCTVPGLLLYTCINCGAEEADELPLAEHIWASFYTVDRESTFTTYGQKSIHCTVCDEQKAGTEVRLARLEAVFSAKKLTLQMGQSTKQLKVSGLTGGDYVKSWSSGNTAIVKVTKKGKITAKNKIGSTKIKITLANKETGAVRTYEIPVKVQKKQITTTQITGLTKKLTIKKGEKFTLNPILKPITSQQKLTYSSNRANVASVSAKGVITAHAAGKARITVCSGAKKYVITVTVPKTETVKITVRASISVKKGKSRILRAAAVPGNSDEKITFTSKNRKIVLVDQRGRITGVKKGKTKIVIKSGNVTKICKVTVK